MSDKLKVAVLGSGGIIGTHMMISVPPDVDAIFVRKTPSPLGDSLDLNDWPATEAWLNARRPDVIVNLAGESRVDVVERDPAAYHELNAEVPWKLKEWCLENDSHLVHVSSQAAIEKTANYYGQQKLLADEAIEGAQWCTIVRPTFVLGIRPFPAIGRENPAEQMLGHPHTLQVCDRWFSVSFAWDVAAALWRAAKERPQGRVIHVGNPERLSRYELARMLNPDAECTSATHAEFEGQFKAAPRPLDTTFKDAHYETPLAAGLERLRTEYAERAADALPYRARELAAFLKFPYIDTLSTLAVGFGPLHNAVTADFRDANPQTDDELLAWYRGTLAYLWELTAYHCDAGFNYAGMCGGIIARLKSHQMPSRFKGLIDAAKDGGVDTTDHSDRSVKRVLCLGDGVGTLTIKMKEAGLEPVYHDLFGSRTAAFAQARFAMRFTDSIPERMTTEFEPPVLASYDAICSLDYLEHVPNVETWVHAIFDALKPGGLFCAQNAFGFGSGPDGAIPQHLACNDRFEKDWDPMLREIGFVQLASNWYQKPEGK